LSRSRVRRLAALPLLAVVLTSSGCQFGRQWFQMSSDSMPFFGFDLLPRRSSTRPIAAGNDDELSIQTADDRESGRTAFEPRIIPTPSRDTRAVPPAEQPNAIELPSLGGRSNEFEADADAFGQPFPEPLRMSAGM
jgi:hypothetical protein